MLPHSAPLSLHEALGPSFIVAHCLSSLLLTFALDVECTMHTCLVHRVSRRTQIYDLSSTAASMKSFCRLQRQFSILGAFKRNDGFLHVLRIRTIR